MISFAEKDSFWVITNPETDLQCSSPGCTKKKRKDCASCDKRKLYFSLSIRDGLTDDVLDTCQARDCGALLSPRESPGHCVQRK